MTEQRIAQIVLSQQHGNHDPGWKQNDWAELELAMDSTLWNSDPKELLPIATGMPSKPKPQTKPEPITEQPSQENEKPKLKSITAYELVNMDIPDVKWFVEKLIPEGLTLLAGDAKIGKSFFAWNIALAVAEGGIALSEIQIDTPRNVVYMAMEDPLPLLQERLNLMCPDGVPNNVHVVNDFFGLKFDNEGLAMVSDCLDETQSELLIVDTWGHVKPNPQMKGGTSYDNDYAALMPVQRFAHERNIAVILVTHTTKGKDLENQFNNIQGSMGMQAGCDTMLMIERGQHGHALRATGRRIMETEYAMTLDDGTWKLEGDASEFNISERRKQLLTFIAESGQDGITVTDLTDLAETSKQNVSKILLKMVSDGLIVRPKRGRYKLA